MSGMEDVKNFGLRAFAPVSVAEAKMLNPLALAYIGDAVFENYVREIIVLTDDTRKVHLMHRKAIAVVNAHSQASLLEKIKGELDEKELYIVQRGKNSKPHTVPKNADVLEYKAATAFEALLGYLYVIGEEERLAELLKKICIEAGLLEKD